MTPQALIPALLAPLLGYRLYRRFRSNFGQQPIQTKRMVLRVVVLSAVSTAFLVLAVSHLALMAAAAGGLAFGGVLALLGLRLTRFENGPNGAFYTPNPYIGFTLSAILIARLVYRFVAVAPVTQLAAGGDPFASFQQSPLTLAILMLTIGYYLTYFAGILVKHRLSPPRAP